MVASPCLCYKAAVAKLKHAFPALLLLLALCWLYRPVFTFALMGDDYQWVQHAQVACHRLSWLFRDLDTFYRPANTWTLALDRLLWPFSPGGFHFSNLLWQWAAATLLALASSRLGLGKLASWCVAACWALSPFAEESAVSVAIRFENLLFFAWLLLVFLWRERQRLSPSLWLAILLALASKETWVVTPLLCLALAWSKDKKSLGQATRLALPVFLLAGAYVALYFVLFPGDKNYFHYDLRPLWKLPTMLAAFFHLQPPVPLAFPFTFRGVLALLVTALLAVVLLRRRDPVGTVGVFFLVGASLPTLLVPYLPPRYMAVPYAGFLLLMASFCQRLWGQIRGPWRWPAAAFGLGFLGLLLAAQGAVVRADLRDWARVSQVHTQLVEAARRSLPLFPQDRPVVVVRADGTNPLRDIALSVEGWPKLFYVRGSDPAGLIDAAALFQWALANERCAVRALKADQERDLVGKRGAVLVYTEQGFVPASLEEPNLATAVASWRGRGFPLRVVEAYPLPKLSL